MFKTERIHQVNAFFAAKELGKLAIPGNLTISGTVLRLLPGHGARRATPGI